MLVLGSLSARPSLKKLGMATGSLLFRCRELSSRLKAVRDLLPDDLADATEPCGLKPTPVVEPGSMPAGAWLSLACADALERLPFADASASFETVTGIVRGDWDWLNGDKGLLKRLPAIQEEITRRIYQEDLNS